jgi:hypothetical protein
MTIEDFKWFMSLVEERKEFAKACWECSHCDILTNVKRKIGTIARRREMKELPIDFWIGTIGLLIAFYIIGRGFK